MSSSQLTNSYFSEGVEPPTRYCPGFFSGALSYEESMVPLVVLVQSVPFQALYWKGIVELPWLSWVPEFSWSETEGWLQNNDNDGDVPETVFACFCCHVIITLLETNGLCFCYSFWTAQFLRATAIFDPSLLEKIWIKSCIFPGSDGSTRVFYLRTWRLVSFARPIVWCKISIMSPW